ncbi:hypothetical protein DMUE_3091 [Dictyocoela muelleri]|nr:hypothetical protein DMUE_3091 [Dictyocoela muelleri]
MNPTLILGLDFLKKVGARIDFINNKVFWGSTKLNILSRPDVSSIEEKIDKVSKIYNNQEYRISDKVTELLNKNDSEIKNVGLIPNFEHEINLKENTIINMQPFRIPMRLKEKTKCLIDQLIKEKIICPSNSLFTPPLHSLF